MSLNNPAARLAYRPEELLALRGSASNSRVSLERFPDEEVIKEHVIKKTPSGNDVTTVENVRPSVPLSVNATNSRLDLAVRSRQPNVGQFGLTTNKRPSPTPSVKRSKAEQLLKQHGSPPHVRVTAGGRIVPNDLPQLGSPRVPLTPVFNPRSHGRMPYPLTNGPQKHPQLPNGFLGYNAYGKLIQWLDGCWHDVHLDGYGQPVYQVSPPNMPFPSVNAALGYVGSQLCSHLPYFRQQQHSYHSPTPNNVVPSDVEARMAANKSEYERVRQDKIELERHEVKSSDQMSATQRAQIVAEKRKYILMLDKIRKQIKDLEAMKTGDNCIPVPNSDSAHMNSNGSTTASTFPTPVYEMGGIDGANGAGPAQTWHMQPSIETGCFPTDSYHAHIWNTCQPVQVADGTVRANTTMISHQQHSTHTAQLLDPEPSPSSRTQPRRSHAVQIRDPNEGIDDDATVRRTSSTPEEQQPSNLNPASPSYEPGKPYPLMEGSPPPFVVPAPTPIETPNSPPAELAKHWVFSQQIQSSGLMQDHGQVLTRGDSREVPASDQMQRVYREVEFQGPAYGNRCSNEDNAERSSQHPTSHSSVTTTDFFPVNTHEHSLNKYITRKGSAAARLSMENNPRTPMRDSQSGAVSPVSDHLHPPVPPVSPASYHGIPPHFLASSPEDMRLSSFLRDTGIGIEQLSEEQIPEHSPVRPETRVEFQGKSKSYLEGYIAGSSGHAPTDPKNQDYCAGYIDGLSKMCLGGTTATRRSSTMSVKSQTIPVSRTPPNTTDNRSLIAELAGTQPNRGENIRLTQSLNFSPPEVEGNHRGDSVVPRSTDNFTSDNSYQETTTKVQQLPNSDEISQGRLPRAWSEDISEFSTSQLKSRPIRQTGVWNVPVNRPRIINNNTVIAPPQTAVTSYPHSADHRNNRMVSTSVHLQQPFIGYSENQPAASVGSIAQHSVFGDDKYVVTTATVDANKTVTSHLPLHENQLSISTNLSRNSQFDGTMNDLKEMQESHSASTTQEPNKNQKNCAKPTSAMATRIPASTNVTTETTPPTSPSKSSNIGSKKVTSPRHCMQQFKDKVSDFLDRGSYGGSGERQREPSRAASPDPKHMNQEEKKRWKEGWRNKLGAAKAREDAEVRKWRRERGQAHNISGAEQPE